MTAPFTTQVPRQKKSSGYSDDMDWATKRLFEGYHVWCIRRKENGLVQGYIACADLSTWVAFEGQPLHLFFVQPVVVSPQAGNAMFGPECAWPRPKEEA
jgi:hypothetical protein